MKLSENIAYLRKRRDITQEELTDLCAVPRQAVTKWETGESTPALDKLCLLADTFEVSLDELVGREGKNKEERFKELLAKFAARDIPLDDNDDISAIFQIYFEFTDAIGLESSDVMYGLQLIFLSDLDEE